MVNTKCTVTNKAPMERGGNFFPRTLMKNIKSSFKIWDVAPESMNHFSFRDREESHFIGKHLNMNVI